MRRRESRLRRERDYERKGRKRIEKKQKEDRENEQLRDQQDQSQIDQLNKRHQQDLLSQKHQRSLSHERHQRDLSREKNKNLVNQLQAQLKGKGNQQLMSNLYLITSILIGGGSLPHGRLPTIGPGGMPLFRGFPAGGGGGRGRNGCGRKGRRNHMGGKGHNKGRGKKE